MLKIGLTGGIGSGKTAVSEQFKKLGIPVIDTDIISRDLLQSNPEVQKKVMDIFSDKVLDAEGAIDRKKLAQIVFSNKQQKQQLEKLLHPAIRNEVNRQIQHFSSSNTQAEYLIIVIPLLLETGFTDLIDRILVVISEEKIRIERIKQRDNRALSQINAIISSQIKDEKRVSAADDIIDNNDNFESLTYQIKQLDKKYRQLS